MEDLVESNALESSSGIKPSKSSLLSLDNSDWGLELLSELI